jgi:spoIIIJ-associated protein
MEEKTTLEVIAPTVQDAVEKGLTQLGLSREAVRVEVLDEGSHGLFGIGSRQARVRLVLPGSVEKEQQEVLEVMQVPAEAIAGKRPEKNLQKEPAERASRPAKAEERPREGEAQAAAEDDATETAGQVLSDLLAQMQVEAKISSRWLEPTDERDERVLELNIEGNDLSFLIGRRSETLNALQYVTSLIVDRRLGRWVPLSVDVQGYRHRREHSLRQLARRMAEQATQTGRRQVLEPMPANERRIIHLELKDHPAVSTQSVGQEPYRKVTIVPKNRNNGSKESSREAHARPQ